MDDPRLVDQIIVDTVIELTNVPGWNDFWTKVPDGEKKQLLARIRQRIGGRLDS